MPHRRLTRLAAILLISAAGAAGAVAQTAEEPAADAAAEGSVEPAVDTVVATVNGDVVTLGEVIMVRAGLPPQYQQVPDAQLYEAIVEQLVNRTLLAQAAAEKGYGDSKVAEIRATFDRRDFLANLHLGDLVAAAAGEEAIRAAYEERYVNVEPVTEIRASHILVAEKELADELHAKLQEGADFAELAKEHGTDGTKERGGDLGYFTKGDMVPAFSDAAFALEVGEVSEPVESQFGWHLILLADKRERPAPPFEEVRETVGRELASEAVGAEIDRIREGAEIATPETGLDASVIRRDDLVTVE